MFGLNSHLYFGTGDVLTGLEKKENVMKAMQSLLISAHQVLEKMQLINNFEFYKSKNIRAYLKTKKGFFLKNSEDVSQIINCCEISFFNGQLITVYKDGEAYEVSCMHSAVR